MSGDPYPKSSWSRQPGARSGATLTCRHCGGEFYVEPFRMRSTIKPKYCSLSCVGKQRMREASAYAVLRREFSLKRKGEHRCRACGSTEHVHAHHAIPASIGTVESRLDLRNLLPLCWSCHGRWHKGVPLSRDVFTADEWAYISSVALTGRETGAWLDRHYPERAYGIEYRR